MVLYFSGTGNSQYTAQIIAEKTKDNIVSINQLMKKGSKEKLVSPNKPFVFVCPTYAWRIPRVVEEYIKASSFLGNNKVYFILTCGEETANAIGYINRLCKIKGFHLKGFAEIVMPDNYIFMYAPPEKAAAKEMIQKSTFKTIQIAEIIRDGLAFPNFIPKARLKSSIVNEVFYKLLVKDKGFHATEKCINCKQCVQICPLNNIEMHERKPSWKNRCTHCMACISCCPTTAIEYKNKTQGKTRYYLECK